MTNRLRTATLEAGAGVLQNRPHLFGRDRNVDVPHAEMRQCIYDGVGNRRQRAHDRITACSPPDAIQRQQLAEGVLVGDVRSGAASSTRLRGQFSGRAVPSPVGLLLRVRSRLVEVLQPGRVQEESGSTFTIRGFQALRSR